MEQEIFTGALLSPKDDRDYIYGETLGKSPMPFNWNIGYDIEEVLGFKLPVKNQGRSNSCGGQAWATYNSVLECINTKTFEEESAKFIFAQTHVGDSGSRGRDNSDLCVKKGVCIEPLCHSYEQGMPPTNDFMISNDITHIAYTNALNNKNKAYSIVRQTVEDLAIAIRDNYGVVFGIYGNNNGTWLSAYPESPKVSKSDCWAHWVYVSKAKLINGVKYFGLLNSWGDVGEKGWQWIKADDYVNYLFEVWAMTPLEDVKFIFTKTLRIGSKGFDVKMLQIRLGINADGIFGRNTKAAVIAFQILHLLTPDGICGPKTIISLNK